MTEEKADWEAKMDEKWAKRDADRARMEAHWAAQRAERHAIPILDRLREPLIFMDSDGHNSIRSAPQVDLDDAAEEIESLRTLVLHLSGDENNLGHR